MALQFDYDTFTITIPKTDLLLVSSSPSEVRELNINDLRTWLHDEQDDPRGMTFPTMFENNPPVDISGVTLARVLRILPPYTITFDDDGGSDPYNVNIVGGNSNVSDVVNKNTVGVNTANSAGLQDPFALQQASFVNGEVAIDTVTGSSGTTFPRGTRAFPVNNISDALTICQQRGIRTIHVLGDGLTQPLGTSPALTLTSNDFSDGYTFTGDGPFISEIVIQSGANITNCKFVNMTISSAVLDNNNTFIDCELYDIDMFDGLITHCSLKGAIQLNPNSITELVDCYSGYASHGPTDYPIIDFANGVDADCLVRNYSGRLLIQNMTQATNDLSVDFTAGTCIIDGSVTAGEIIIRGDCELEDNHLGTANVDLQNTASEIWHYMLENDLDAEEVMRILLSVAAGKSSITDLGGGNATVAFRDQGDTKDRVSASMTNAERTSTTVDGTM